jgi:hypothetical protein
VKKNIYLILAIVGLLVPYYFFFRFFSEGGFNLSSLTQQLLANDLSTAFVADLVISVLVFWVYLFAEANRLQMKNAGFYVLATLLVGLSFSLPLFLYFRERTLEAR